jgi:Holliday junction resolvasome RuvABC DNA-binding subunit
MRVINAKFNSTCYETGCRIKKGERCVYDPATKRVYGIGTETAIAVINGTDRDPAAGMIQANEEAYFDNFCQSNNI